MACTLKKIALYSACFLLLVPMSTMVSGREPQALSGAPRGSAAEQRVAEHLARIRQDPPALRAFLRAFPKGADLHTHLTGAVYAR